MRLQSVDQLCEVIAGGFIQVGVNPVAVEQINIDSRRIVNPGISVFFALSGDRQNGHQFIFEAYQKGVRCFVVQQDVALDLLKDAWVIKVPNSLIALQELAKFHRNLFKFPVVGITGSNGKTIVKEWLYQLLKDELEVERSPKSYNSQVGVPLSIWQSEIGADLGIFEAGISQPGEMSALRRMIQPQLGIFTNLGTAHDENFKDWEEKAKEKLILFEEVQKLVYCRDYQILHDLITKKERFKHVQTFTWSKKMPADLMIGKIDKQGNHSTIQGVYKNSFIKITIPFSDDASVENAIQCWCFLLMQGYDQEWISERMNVLAPVAMRLELKEGVNGCSIINDYYNSDFGSLEIALDFINQQKQQPNKTVILSDILQTGKSLSVLYKLVGQLLQQKGVTKLIGIGREICSQTESFHMPASFYPTTEAFLKNVDIAGFTNETILLKGARPFGFERISTLFQRKVHETVLEINLNALVHNLNYFRSELEKDTKIMAMVKALSYGSGTFEIANVLQYHHVDYLAVAFADEGVELRKAGISLPIMVMNPDQHSYDMMIQHQLEPEIYSFKVLALFEKALDRHQIKKGYPIHIKLDTGMRRLGFAEAQWQELVIRLSNNKRLKVASVFSHLATADEPFQKDFTLEQISLFKKGANFIEQHLRTKVIKHILNSHGISAFPEAQMDMCRLGIGLYGVSGFKSVQDKLQAVSELKTVISQIKHVPEGTSIGYGRKEICKKDSIIATVPIGYADGLRRSLGNRKGYMMIKGKQAPIVGNVCMDMCMLDVSHIHCEEGDEVVVFGKGLSIQTFAEFMDTIPYEALTGISPRVKRVFFQE